MIMRGSAVAGATVLGVAYVQRMGMQESRDHRTAWSQGLFTRLYRSAVAPVVMQIDPEFAHAATLAAGSAFQAVKLLSEPAWTGITPLDWLLRPSRPANADETTRTPTLRQELFGGRLRFDSPIGIAAGFDKNAALVPLYKIGGIPGLGFSEIGSVSAQPSGGNERPRCFRLVEDEAVINRMGLNNDGADVVAARLETYSCLGKAGGSAQRMPIGINIAKTHSPDIMGEKAVADFVTSYSKLEPYADFVVLNVSCPNTAEGKTFEEPATLTQLLNAVAKVRGPACPPLLVKLSPPPLSDAGKSSLAALVKVVEKAGIVDGFVVSNTVGDRDVQLAGSSQDSASSIGRGGLSGKPICQRSTNAIRVVYEATAGRYPIIGVGGVDSAESAYEKIKAGASLVEVYTGIVYNGPGLLPDLKAGIQRLLDQDGFSNIQEAVGVDGFAGFKADVQV